jgi:hypothetical protein
VRRGQLGQLRYRGGTWERFNGRRWAPAAYSADKAALHRPADLRTGPVLPGDQRTRLLDQVLDEELLKGAGVLARRPFEATLAYRRPVSHVLHAILSVVTGGLWVVVWIVMAIARTDDRVRLEVDPQGHVWVSQAG